MELLSGAGRVRSPPTHGSPRLKGLIMKMQLLAAAAATSVGLCAAFAAGSAGAATFYGPSAYASAADAPFDAADFDSYFYLEDVEDSAINTPGLSVTGPSLCISGFNCFTGSGLIDSVGNGGNGNAGHSIFTNGSTQIDFDTTALGGLPTFAGLVWTDGNNPITFEAFDQNGLSLGFLNGQHADGSFSGTLGDDRFYGVAHAGGISRLLISNPPGTEIDHIQYGRDRQTAPIPEPGAWALMIVGFGGAGVMLRRRRWAAA